METIKTIFSKLTQFKQWVLSIVMLRFLRKNAKPLMVHIYKAFYLNEMRKVLVYFAKYGTMKSGEGYLPIVFDLLKSDNDWSDEQLARYFGMCVFCGFISAT